jgi:hypothetical protein
MLGLLGAEPAHQPLQRVAQMPLAQVQLGIREAGADRVGETVVVAGDAPVGR